MAGNPTIQYWQDAKLFQPIPVFAPGGPAASAQSISNSTVKTYVVAAGTLVRCSAPISQGIYVRSGNVNATAPTTGDLQSCNAIPAGGSIDFVSLGQIFVCADTSTSVSWAPALLLGAESQ